MGKCRYDRIGNILLQSEWGIGTVWQDMECHSKQRRGDEEGYLSAVTADRIVLQTAREEMKSKMKYPCLVPQRLCKTDIHVEIEQEGLDKYGEALPKVVLDLKCNFQDKAKTIFTEQKKLVQITGTALFPGDIVPELPSISGGTVTVYGVQRKIEQGSKSRNPDGSVNFCKLEVV